MFKADELPVVGILRGIAQEHIIPLSGIFLRNGIRYIEVTMNTANAPELIKDFVKAGKDELIVGAGTVLSTDDFEQARSAGAAFIVSPSVIPSVISRCTEEEIPVFPGALTPTEVHNAWELGATMVKLFPASLFGMGYIRALKGPFDSLRIMAVGGISVHNVRAFMDYGADAVAFGAGLVRPALLEAGKYDEIEELLSSFIAAIRGNAESLA